MFYIDGLGHNIINIAIQNIVQIILIWVVNWLSLFLGIAYYDIESMHDLPLKLCNNLLFSL